jgi:hypothetical protein
LFSFFQLWRFVVSDLQVDPDRSDAGFRLRLHYSKYLLELETACVAAEQAVAAGSTDAKHVELARFVAMTPEEHLQRVATSVASARASCSALLTEPSDSLAQPVAQAPHGLMLHEVAYMNTKAAAAAPTTTTTTTTTTTKSVRSLEVKVPVAPKALVAKVPVQAGTRKRATTDSCDDDDDDDFETTRPSKQLPDYVTVQKKLNNLAVGRVRPAEIVDVAKPQRATADDDSTEELATIAMFLTRLRDDFAHN